MREVIRCVVECGEAWHSGRDGSCVSWTVLLTVQSRSVSEAKSGSGEVCSGFCGESFLGGVYAIEGVPR